MNTRDVRYTLQRALEAEPQMLSYFAKCYPDTLVSKRRAILAGCCASGRYCRETLAFAIGLLQDWEKGNGPLTP